MQEVEIHHEQHAKEHHKGVDPLPAGELLLIDDDADEVDEEDVRLEQGGARARRREGETDERREVEQEAHQPDQQQPGEHALHPQKGGQLPLPEHDGGQQHHRQQADDDPDRKDGHPLHRLVAGHIIDPPDERQQKQRRRLFWFHRDSPHPPPRHRATEPGRGRWRTLQNYLINQFNNIYFYYTDFRPCVKWFSAIFSYFCLYNTNQTCRFGVFAYVFPSSSIS